jgi:hypothetical protein
VPTSGGGGKPEPELDRLSNIIKAFNDQFGNINWKDADRIRQVISEEIPAKVAADKAYQNAMRNSDKAAARLEHGRELLFEDHLIPTASTPHESSTLCAGVGADAPALTLFREIEARILWPAPLWPGYAYPGLPGLVPARVPSPPLPL